MKRHVLVNILIVLGGILVFVPFLGQVHLFDWDEINFAESAREMLVLDDYLTVRIFFEPFWEKPPMFIWMQVVSMKLFGVNEFAARFPNAICGIATLLVLFNLGRRLYNIKFGIIWTIAYFASILPFFYFKSGIIDPWFNLFIFLGIFFWVDTQFKNRNSKKYLPVALSALFIGLAILTKGPVAGLVFGLSVGVLLLLDRFRFRMNIFHILVFLIVLALSGGFWFLLQIFTGNYDLVVDFIVYQIRLFSQEDAGHGGFPLYHFVILLFGVFPASIFAIQGHKRAVVEELNLRVQFRKIMIVLFWVVLILFSIVKTKIVHYSSLCYFPLSFLAAYSVYYIIEGKLKLKVWLIIGLVFISSILSILIIALPIFDRYKHWFINNGYVTHSFTVGNLQADPGWGLIVSLVGAILITGTVLAIRFIRKKQMQKGFLVMAISSSIFVYLSILTIIQGAEKYSQNAVIEFFKEHKGEDVYFTTLYKSFAGLFYGQMQPEQAEVSNKWYRLCTTEDLDKTAYFVLRIDKKEEVLSKYDKLEVLYEKNGYVFCVRYP